MKTRGQLLTAALALVLGCFFYAAGNFGFLNLFDVRREIQILFLFLLIPALPVVISRCGRWLRQPLWWMVAIALVADLFMKEDQSIFFVFDRAVAVFVVALLFSFSHTLSDKILKTVIVLASVFSTMVVIQAMIVWLEPHVLWSFELNYTSSTQAAKVEVGHPLEYLGFVTPGVAYVSGHPFSRFRSFVSEPSVIINSFLAPGILALGYHGPVRYAALPILLFAGLLSASGTAWLSIALGVVAYLLISIFKRRVVLLAILPFALAFLWYLFLTTMDVEAFLESVTAAVKPIEPYEGALDKRTSGMSRFGLTAKHLGGIEQYLLFGAPVAGVGGFLLHMLLYAGLAGLILAIMVNYKVMKLTIRSFLASKGMRRVMAGLLYGMFLQVLVINEYGWMSMPGFMLLALITRRLEFLVERDRSMVRNSSPAESEPGTTLALNPV